MRLSSLRSLLGTESFGIRTERSAIILALIFATVVMLPTVLQRFDAAYPYGGVATLGPDAEVYYAARVREIYDGFSSLGNTFYSAPKDQPYMQPPLPEWTIATVGRLLHVSAISMFFIAKFLLSFLVFLVFVFLLFSITNSPWVSILSVTVTLFAGALFAAPWDIGKFLRPMISDFEYLRFARAVNPQWSGFWFLASLLMTSQWIARGKRFFILSAAVCTGVLVYSYVYAWTYLCATIGLLTLYHVFRRDWRRIADLSLYWIVLSIIAVPYVMHTIVLVHHPWYAESSKRLGLVARHTPVIFGVWLGVFIAMALFSRRVWSKTWPLLPSIAIAGFIAINQHVVTGQYIVPHHYHWYFTQPLATALAVALMLTILSPLFLSVRTRRLVATTIIIFAVLCGVVQQWGAYGNSRTVWGTLQPASPILQYVDEHFRPGQVVYSQDVNILNLVPIYTGADVYYAGNANLALAPLERARTSYFFGLWLQGVRPETALKEFSTTRRFELSSRLHDIYYREFAGNYEAIPDDEVALNVSLYEDFVRLPMKKKLSLYPLHVIITTPRDIQGPPWKSLLACSTSLFAVDGYDVRLMIPGGQNNSCF